MSTIITRNSTTSGSIPSSLAQGELAINVTDNRLFFGSGSGNAVKEFGVTSSYAFNALSASYAATASLAPLYLPLTGGTISGNVTVLGTASVNTLIVNQTQLSTGSNQLGDAADDFQTLYGTVRIPTGSLTVTGSLIVSGSAGINNLLTLSTGLSNGALIGGTSLVEADNQPGYTQLLITPNSGNKAAVFLFAPSGTATSSVMEFYHSSSRGTSQRYVFKNNNGLLQIGGDGASLPLEFISNNASTMRMFANGNFAIGSTTDAGFKLDVNGTARFVGNVTNNGNVTFRDNLNIADSGQIYRSSGPIALQSFAGVGNNQSVLININPNVTSISNVAILAANSTTKGFLPPRTNLTSNISTPVQGLMTYVTASATEGLYYYSSGSIRAWTRLLNDTGSQAISGSLTITGSNPLLRLNGSGSELMSVDGASGRLFTVSDDLSNSLFSVNTIAGLPVMEAFATNDVFLGKYNTYPIKTVASGTLAVITGSISGSVAAPGSTTQIVFNNGGVLGADSGFVYSGSRVGIGTTTPLTKLDIGGNSTNTIQAILARGSDPNFQLVAENGDAGSGGYTMAKFGLQFSGVVNVAKLYFQRGSGAGSGAILTDAPMRIGDASINLTTAQLTVKGTGTTSATTALLVQNSNTSASLSVLDNGNVGVGTSSPAYTLDVRGGDLFVTGSRILYASNIRPADNGGTISFNNFGGTLAGRMFLDGSIWRFKSSTAVDTLNIFSNGNLGIRQTSDAGFALDVAGITRLNAGSGNDIITDTNVTINGYAGSGTVTRFQSRNAAAALLYKFTIPNQSDTAGSFIGNLLTTGSLQVAGTTRISGSFNTAASGSILTVIGSGSAQPIFTVQGSQGELFSITDSLSGSLFSVNDISGLPILEVFSDNTTLIGNYQDPMLITTAKVVQTNSGSFTVYSLPTASYDTAFFEYSVKSGSNARAGTIMAIQLGSSVNFTETTTTDFGDTTPVSFTVIVTGSNMALTGSSTTGSWTIKTIVRGL